MRVAHLSTYLSGGAAIAARRLHEALIDEGVESNFIYGQANTAFRKETEPPSDTYHPVNRNRSGLGKAWRAIGRRLYPRDAVLARLYQPLGVERFRFPEDRNTTDFSVVDASTQVLNLHWISEFLDYSTFFRSVPDEFPVVWTMHDMTAFTAGCNYACDCQRFKTGCHDCPQLGGWSPTDLAKRAYEVKLKAIAQKNIHFVANSTWIEAQARCSPLLVNAKSFRTIHYGVDTSVFAPKDRSAARRELGVKEDAKIIAFGAVSLSNKRKGATELAAALGRLGSSEELLLLSFGEGRIDPTSHGLATKHLGFRSSGNALATIYAAADVFVAPSLHEAFGQTVLESLACGTPVVAFETGGIPDMITEGETGLLARTADVDELARKLRWILEHPVQRREMGVNARKMVEREYGLERQARSYMDLYEEITGKGNG